LPTYKRAWLGPPLRRPHDGVWVVQLTNGIHVPRVPCLEGRSHDLHVLLRHRLLRQPHGFEGLFFAPVVVESHALAVSQRPHRTVDPFHINAGLATLCVNAQHGDDALTSVDELLRIPAPAFPTALPISLPTKQTFQPSVLPRVGYVVIVEF